MKIAFILTSGIFVPTHGVVSQALTWKTGLEQLGNEVFLINMWEKNDWKSFDIIHFYGYSDYMSDAINNISKVNTNIVVSPILDPDYSINRLKLYARWGSLKLKLSNRYHSLFSSKDKIKLFLVRSKFEKEYIVKGIGVREKKCSIVPLSFNGSSLIPTLKREPFCLHISLLTDERKNVKRLIEAAIKYNFHLVLGGKLRNEGELKLLKSWIGNNNNIEYHGYLSEDEMMSLYSRAKVFALPSTNEGVGIVAIEAASLGCDIVITNIGGPKEYYNGMAKVINPYSIDEIGQAVHDLMKGETYQPELKNYIQTNFSLQSVSRQLLSAYKNISDLA